MNAAASISIQQPALPKGGGAIKGMGEALGAAGPSGAASMSLPLPISAGRGYAPALGLGYSSQAGNGTFGLGWGCGTGSVSRRTSHGVPQYNENDELIGPGGEVLVAETDAQGKVVNASCNSYGGITLSDTYTVTRYFTRIDSGSDRLEWWLGSSESFWLLHDSDGQLHMFGKTTAARVADPLNAGHVAAWLLEESVSPTGEHIYYQYQAEDAKGIDLTGNEALRDYSAQRYLTAVQYGNRTQAANLYLWNSDPAAQSWLFTLVFDYGQRTLDAAQPPAFAPSNDWPARPDAFSSFAWGFELRTHRLCQQVLMFHHFPDELDEPDTLVGRLLLEYQQSPVATLLTAAQSLAYEADGTVQHLPLLELEYTPLTLNDTPENWRQVAAHPGIEGGNYHLVDLYGEGIPGVLYRSGADWQYREPLRAASGGDDVTYGSWQSLPQLPAMQGRGFRLMDITGDGKLDWLISLPGAAGFFTLNPDKSWGEFTPFNALPTEFYHPQSQFAQLMGSGLADLALIGPNSVRLYANRRDGFAMALDVAQGENVTLPVAGRDGSELVAFADVLGSGQQHLVRVRHDGLTCWPNLGRGQFGQPLALLTLDYDEQSFNPEQVFFADVDGSGAVDLVYAHGDRLDIYLNQSGNGFAEPVTLSLPDGVNYDRLCQLMFADVQGSGTSELVLSVPYGSPSQWLYSFNQAKPYLLCGCNNNMGSSNQIIYRSSAQEWLDEKQENPEAASALPIAMHLLVQSISTDEITGNVLSQSCRYRRGVYDGREREFRGFGYVETEDTNQDASSSGDSISFAPPAVAKIWYHCGRESDEAQLYGQPYQDDKAYILGATRLTQYDADKLQDVQLTDVDDDTRWWMYRALKGSVLRAESYGLDGSEQQDLPYGCATSRFQVRLVQAGAANGFPVVMPMGLESLSSHYDRIISDPVISQQVLLQADEFGHVMLQVTVSYPRNPQPDVNPYPSLLPATSWSSSYDEQQQKLRLVETRSTVHNLTDAQAWRLGLPDQQRLNQLAYSADRVPAGGLSFEALSDKDGLLGIAQARIFSGQSQVSYLNTPPDFLALVDHTVSAVLDDVTLQAYDDIEELADFDFTTLGYVWVDKVLPVNGAEETPVWAVESGFSQYDDAEHFYRVTHQQSTLLTGETALTSDDYCCALIKTVDALGNTSLATIDYRFLTPWRQVDSNGNTSEVQIDALGRVIANSFYGTEQGVSAGFSSVTDFPQPAGQTVEEVIDNAGSAPQQLAALAAYDLFSWCGTLTTEQLTGISDRPEALWERLQTLRFISAQGQIRQAARRWLRSPTTLSELPVELGELLATTGGIPIHRASLVADNYPANSAQQIGITVGYSDGFGRTLQQSGKAAAGPAYQRTDSGELAVDGNDLLVTADTDNRWAVSGKVEFDNKGQPVRSYQPYFVNDWRYVADTALRTYGYCDVTYYDAAGRGIKTVTAKGYLRRVSYFPWFSVSEDENDTYSEVQP